MNWEKNKINLRYILCQFKDFIIKYESFIFQNIQYYDTTCIVFLNYKSTWVCITMFLKFLEKKPHFLAPKSERKTIKSYPAAP
jgi:hypothetical protein